VTETTATKLPAASQPQPPSTVSKANTPPEVKVL
jgi:hypothetical protein